MPPKKILIIEDENFIAELYSHQLDKAGFNVKIANDGKTGLDFLDRESFDILLLDILLPDINGLEILRELKINNPHSTMIVLLLTNLGQDTVIKESFELGAQGYLIKASLTPYQIVDEVKNALLGRSPQTPPQKS